MSKIFERVVPPGSEELTVFQLLLSRTGNYLAMFESTGKLSSGGVYIIHAVLKKLSLGLRLPDGKEAPDTSFEFELGLRTVLTEVFPGKTRHRQIRQLLDRLEACRKLDTDPKAIPAEDLAELKDWLRSIEKSISKL